MSSFCEKNVFVCTSCGARPQRSLKGRPPVVPGYDPRTIGRTETAGLGARGQVCSDVASPPSQVLAVPMLSGMSRWRANF